MDNDGLTCSTCSPGTFGPNCTQVCACASGAERCDPVSGCVCRQGWEGDKCDKDVDECQSRMSPANCTGQNVECVNTNGGYTCRCRQGFAADNDSMWTNARPRGQMFALKAVRTPPVHSAVPAARRDTSSTTTASRVEVILSTVTAIILEATSSSSQTSLTEVTSLITGNSTEASSTTFTSMTSTANDAALSTDVSNTTATAELTTGQIAGIVVGSVGGVAAGATAVGFVVLKIFKEIFVNVVPNWTEPCLENVLHPIATKRNGNIFFFIFLLWLLLVHLRMLACALTRATATFETDGKAGLTRKQNRSKLANRRLPSFLTYLTFNFPHVQLTRLPMCRNCFFRGPRVLDIRLGDLLQEGSCQDQCHGFLVVYLIVYIADPQENHYEEESTVGA
ncbi:hypothetical protein C0Q70_02985 [Pomacea canaliculata]|uniref:EGF-like domain-containing protein n=1 Tax=Pomacea canaliculata TaxID=400727 RepID=A0A2T7PRH5_POMCA|nr:hypothetical protein C0Q70_02985 [Pomacea canaliculata]